LTELPFADRLSRAKEFILNAASVLDGPLSSGETIYVRGAGFGADSQL